MPLEYEDTVRREIEPCDDCGEPVDETEVDTKRLNALNMWLCPGCTAERERGAY